jgi:hypothetical protein
MRFYLLLFSENNDVSGAESLTTNVFGAALGLALAAISFVSCSMIPETLFLRNIYSGKNNNTLCI